MISGCATTVTGTHAGQSPVHAEHREYVLCLATVRATAKVSSKVHSVGSPAGKVGNHRNPLLCCIRRRVNSLLSPLLLSTPYLKARSADELEFEEG